MRLDPEDTIKGVVKDWSVLSAHTINDITVVVYDYMAFPKGQPARNLFAYDTDGNQLWRADGIMAGATDAYTSIISEDPLKVGNFAGYECTLDVLTGKLLETKFTK